MGLFRAILKCSQGFYSVATENWTYVYYRLLTFYKPRFPAPDRILIAASLINAHYHVRKYKLTHVGLEQAVQYAMEGKCGTVAEMHNRPFMSEPMTHGRPGSFSPSGEASFDLLLNYCVQHCAIVLALDRPYANVDNVIADCIKNKPRIELRMSTLMRDLRNKKGNRSDYNVVIENIMELNPLHHLTLPLENVLKPGNL